MNPEPQIPHPEPTSESGCGVSPQSSSDSVCGNLPQSAEGASLARHSESDDGRSVQSPLITAHRFASGHVRCTPILGTSSSHPSDDMGFDYPPEMHSGPEYESDYDFEEDARERELLMDDLADDNDDFARSEEDGWYYSDED